jgi:hypothetical protein
MKKIIAVFGSLLVLASTKSRAQNPQQAVKKETVKPTNGTAPKADAVEIFLKLDGVQGEGKGANPIVAKGVNPAFVKGANPIYKGAQSDTNNQVARRPIPPQPNNQVARHPTTAPAKNPPAPRPRGPKR